MTETRINSDNLRNQDDSKELKQLFFRSFTVFGPFNYAKQGASGFVYSILPFINKYYSKEEDKREALIRHIVWYNTTSNIGTFVMSLIATMEKENSVNEDFETDSINAVKSSLMGPLSGIGDTLFWGVLRVVAAGIAMPFAAQGNFLAPFMFLLIYNLPSIWTRWKLTKVGYEVGTNAIEKLYSSGMMSTITKAASILGLTVLGGMTSSLVSFNSTLEFNLGGGQVLVLQEILDQIFVGIVPLFVTLGSYYLLSKKKMSFSLVMLIVIALGIIISALGVA